MPARRLLNVAYVDACSHAGQAKIDGLLADVAMPAGERAERDAQERRKAIALAGGEVG